jgi:serine/threonine-protein kinase RsbW
MARVDSAFRPADPFRLALPFQPESASVARDEIDHWLAQIHPPEEVVDDCRLVISELVGNAIRHARPLSDGTMEVCWSRKETSVDICVTDWGAGTTPHRIDAGLSGLAGRGLAIVESLACRWWIETAHSRTSVHAVLKLG